MCRPALALPLICLVLLLSCLPLQGSTIVNSINFSNTQLLHAGVATTAAAGQDLAPASLDFLPDPETEVKPSATAVGSLQRILELGREVPTPWHQTVSYSFWPSLLLAALALATMGLAWRGGSGADEIKGRQVRRYVTRY